MFNFLLQWRCSIFSYNGEVISLLLIIFLANTLMLRALKAEVLSKKICLGVKEKAVEAPGGEEVGRQVWWGDPKLGERGAEIGSGKCFQNWGAKTPHQGAVVWTQRASQLAQRRRGS